MIKHGISLAVFAACAVAAGAIALSGIGAGKAAAQPPMAGRYSIAVVPCPSAECHSIVGAFVVDGESGAVYYCTASGPAAKVSCSAKANAANHP